MSLCVFSTLHCSLQQCSAAPICTPCVQHTPPAKHGWLAVCVCRVCVSCACGCGHTHTHTASCLYTQPSCSLPSWHQFSTLCATLVLARRCCVSLCALYAFFCAVDRRGRASTHARAVCVCVCGAHTWPPIGGLRGWRCVVGMGGGQKQQHCAASSASGLFNGDVLRCAHIPLGLPSCACRVQGVLCRFHQVECGAGRIRYPQPRVCEETKIEGEIQLNQWGVVGDGGGASARQLETRAPLM